MAEQDEANTINVVKNGSDNDIIYLLNHAESLPAGDARKVAILQQYADNTGNRNPPAIGQTALEEIRNGNWNGHINQSWRDRTASGAFNGAKAAAMSTNFLDSQFNALNTVGPRTPDLQAELEAYVQSLKEYRNDQRIKQPGTRITDSIRLVDSSFTPAPRRGVK